MFQMRQFKNKARPLVAKTLLQIAESKRQERRNKTSNLGYFIEGTRNFVEGEALLSIRAIIDDK